MLSAFDLTGRSVLITGASSGIGRQCCLAVAHSGGSVIATGRDPARLRETIDLLGGDKHRFVQADLTIAEEMSYLAKEIGELHGVVHAAGIQQYRVLKYLTPKMIREVMTVNFEAPVLLTQALIKNKRIARGASLVFIGSIAAAAPVIGNSIYSASKAALHAAVRVIALELSGQSARVNSVLPGMVKTAMADRMSTVVASEKMAEHEKEYPLGFGEARDVANAIVFFLSDGSRWVTGQSLVLDGGYTCR